jgi:hypothetical protein
LQLISRAAKLIKLKTLLTFGSGGGQPRPAMPNVLCFLKDFFISQ